MNWKSLAEWIQWGGIFAVLFYWEAVTSFLETIPFIVVQASTVGLVAWVGMDTYTERVPSPPLLVYIGGVIGCIGLTYLWLQGQLTIPNNVIPVLSVPVGILVWFGGTVIASAITVSLLGIDTAKHEREEQRKQTGDPYGDKHAARILNDDNEV